MAILFVSLLLILFVLLTFAAEARVVFVSDLNGGTMRLSLQWLYPFFKGDVSYDGSGPLMSLYLFNKRIYEKTLKAGEHRAYWKDAGRMKLVRNIKLSDVDVEASYGFTSPFATGVACGIIAMISQFANMDTIRQNPDFTPDDDYLYISAAAKLNIGLTAVSLIRAYTGASGRKLSYQH